MAESDNRISKVQELTDQSLGVPGNIFLAACRPDCSENIPRTTRPFDSLCKNSKDQNEVAVIRLYRGSVWRVSEEQSDRRSRRGNYRQDAPV